MRKSIIFTICLMAALLFTGCKTTEQNYHNAYVVAKEKESSKIDPSVQQLIDNENHGLKTDFNGDSIRVKTDFVRIVEPEGAKMPKFGVVVGSFKQVFNARMFYKRLIEKKYSPFVVIDRDGQHFVLIQGFETREEAAEFIKHIDKNVDFKLPIEPFVLAIPSWE